jgi:hypothetical protein
MLRRVSWWSMANREASEGSSLYLVEQSNNQECMKRWRWQDDLKGYGVTNIDRIVKRIQHHRPNNFRFATFFGPGLQGQLAVRSSVFAPRSVGIRYGPSGLLTAVVKSQVREP